MPRSTGPKSGLEGTGDTGRDGPERTAARNVRATGGRSLRLAPLALAISIGGCNLDCALRLLEPSAQKRQIDPAPHESTATSALPDRQAVAFFTFDTGGDHMTLSRKEAGLEVVVRYRTTEWRQTIASCTEPSRGSALGGGTERELDVAACDGEFWLVAEPGTVLVERRDEPKAVTVTTISLPWPDVRAKPPADP